MNRTRHICLTGLLAVLSVIVTSPLYAQGQSIGGYVKVSEVRVTRTVSEFTYRAVLSNAGPALPGATAVVSSLSPVTVVIDKNLAFGAVGHNGTVLSGDTFSFQQDRTVPFDFASLSWAVTPVNVNVPNVVGQTQAAATTSITSALLVVGTVGTANSNSVAAGKVISQNPVAATSVAPGSAVNLVISLGPANVSVPNVVGLTQAAATTSITGAGLVVGTVSTANSSSVAAGSVISQNPVAATSVAPGSAVNLVVSLGPANVSVPNVVGLTQAAATTSITGAGLVVGTVGTANSNSVAAGSVISQNPVAATSVAPGSAVNLVVSLGPANVSVPNVVGLTQAAATTSITGAGLVVGTVGTANSNSVAAGSVISQNPVAATSVAPGSAVNLVVSLGPANVSVPNVVGLTQAAATTSITGAGLVVGTVGTANSNSVAAGSVISQNPVAATSVAPGSAVNLVVSLGPANVSVPNVVGLTQAAATTSITGAGLVVGTVGTANSNSVAAGSVISQNPVAATSVAPGSAVNLVVSLGPANVSVPNVVGLTQAAATTSITGAGLVVGTVGTANSNSVAAGKVISQNPVAATSVAPGSAVNLVVSLGPANVNVPNVVGLTQAAATTSITGAGLVVGTVSTANSSSVAAGSVISQNPVAATSVAPGSAVNLVVSLGPANVNVPNVVGLTQAAATTSITGAGLVVGTVSTANSSSVAAGSVISQNPVAATSVAPGSAVNLVVSLGPANVNVPNVVGLTQAAATTSITGAGLVVGTVSTANSSSVAAGSVISQNPVAATSVAPGSAVNLVVSLGPANVNVPNVVGLTQAAATTSITGAGLVVGTVSTANSSSVAAGSVISQNPVAATSVAPGSAVNLVVSLGPASGPTPTSLDLDLSSLVMAAGSAVNITAVVSDVLNQPIVPTPAITYQILTLPGNIGGLPTVSAGQVLTSIDTRGAYTLRGTVNGTSVTTDLGFAVIDGSAPPPSASTNAGRLVAFGFAEGTTATKMEELSAAFSSGNLAAIPAINAALQAALASAPPTGRSGMERTTAVAPDIGFLPSVGAIAAMFPQTADDVAYGNLIDLIVAKLQQITTFYNNLNPASPTDDEPALNLLNTQLAALQAQLVALHPTPYGIVNNASKINDLIANTLPKHLQAVTGRVNTVLVQNSLASVLTLPQQFYAGVGGSPASGPLTPGASYMNTRPAFFGLLGLFAGCSTQMNLVNKIYGPIMQEVTRMLVIVAANGLLTSYGNFASMEGIISGASLSFHAPNIPGSVIEGTGASDTVSRNDVFFVGPEAVSAVSGVISAFNPSSIKSLADVYKFFDGIVNALQSAGKAYDNAHALPNDVFHGCILDFGESFSCMELYYNSGFPDVNDTHFPSPVMVIYHNLDSGFWSSGIFNFVP